MSLRLKFENKFTYFIDNCVAREAGYVREHFLVIVGVRGSLSRYKAALFERELVWI